MMQDTLPDLVLLDHMMPGLSGAQVCQQLTADPRTAGIPVVVYTAAAESGSDDFRKEIGADYLLRKPAPMPVVLQTIRDALSAPA
jgi:CheY-like chemotaxis protein